MAPPPMPVAARGPAPRRAGLLVPSPLPPPDREGLRDVAVAPDDPARLFVERMEEWRRSLGWSHARFAGYLGVSERFWRLLRGSPDQLTPLVAQRVIDERSEFAHYLGGDPLKFFAERSRRRRRRHRTPPVGSASGVS